MPNPGDVPIYVGPEWAPGPAPVGPTSFGSIIYKPGTASAGDHVATWAEVQTFIATTDGKCIVYVDDSITSPAPVSGAITDCQGRVELRSALNDAVNTSVLLIPDGSTLRDLSIIRGLEVQCDTRGVTPALDFTSASGGNLLIKDFGFLSNAATATQPAIAIAAAKTLFLNMEEGSLILNAPAVPLFSVAATSLLQMWALDATDLSAANPGFASGAGDVELNYDNASAHFFGVAGDPTPPALPGITGTYTKNNVDDVWVTKALDTTTFSTPALNDVPHFDGTKWVAAPVPASGILSEQTIAASGAFVPTTVDVLVFVDTTGGAVNLTLPAPVAGVATRYTFKDSKQNFNVNALTLVPPGAALIEGVNANFVISAQGAHVTVISDGVNYFV